MSAAATFSPPCADRREELPTAPVAAAEPSAAELHTLAADVLRSLGDGAQLTCSADANAADVGQDDAVACWVRTIARQGDIPSAAEALALAASGQRAELARRNLPLAFSVAQRYCPSGAAPEQRMDLIGAANLGLVEASQRFDPDAARTRRCSFSSYAYWWCRKHVLFELYGDSNPERHPDSSPPPPPRYLSQPTPYTLWPTHGAGSHVQDPEEWATIGDLLAAPALHLPPPPSPIAPIHLLAEDVRAAVVAAPPPTPLDDEELLIVLVLRIGVVLPELTRRGWTPPARWTPGRIHPQRIIAAALRVSLGTVQRMLARINVYLASLLPLPEAVRLRAALSSPVGSYSTKITRLAGTT